MIKAFIFDFGGVLVRTEDYRPRHAWDERLGLPTGSVEQAVHYSDIWIQAQSGRITPTAYWQEVAERLRLNPDDMAVFCRDYFSGDSLNHTLVTLVRDLREKKYRTALLSNDTAQLEGRLRDYGLYDLFDPVLISAQVGLMKPDPAIYHMMLQRLGVAPHEAVFIDDSPANVQGAQPLGIHTILFRPEIDLELEIKRLIEANQEP